jgi:SAM-dependent methyltransferase
MTDRLTDRQFWIDYWENKKDLIKTVPAKIFFSPVFNKIYAENRTIKKSIEIGGYPGYFSIYLKKYFNTIPTLLDYVIHKKRLDELLKLNLLGSDDLNLLETDLFKTVPHDIYDLTFSSGFIEHFSDTTDLILRHVNYTKPGGVIFISVPNFLGFNGWINKTFDRPLYDKHYLKCMDKVFLKNCAKDCGLVDIETFYFGKFSIWLENISTKNIAFRTIFKIIWLAGKIFTKLIPVESKFFSPYTILIAKKI